MNEALENLLGDSSRSTMDQNAMLAVKNPSIKMNITNLLWQLDLRKYQEHLGLLVDQCFKWLANPAETAANKVYCMEILYNVASFIPELRDELVSTIQDQVSKSSQGVQCRGMEVLKRLQVPHM